MTEKVSMGGVAWRNPFPPVEGFHGANVLTLHTVAAQSLRARAALTDQGEEEFKTETDGGCHD